MKRIKIFLFLFLFLLSEAQSHGKKKDSCESLLTVVPIPSELPERPAALYYKGFEIRRGQVFSLKGSSEKFQIHGWSQTLEGNWIVNYIPVDHKSKTGSKSDHLDTLVKSSKEIRKTYSEKNKMRENPESYDGFMIGVDSFPDLKFSGTIYRMRILDEIEGRKIVSFTSLYPVLSKRIGIEYDSETGVVTYPDIVSYNNRLRALGIKFKTVPVTTEISDMEYGKIVLSKALPYATKESSAAIHYHDFFSHALGLAYIPEKAFMIARSRLRFLMTLQEKIPDSKEIKKLLREQLKEFDLREAEITIAALLEHHRGDAGALIINALRFMGARSAHDLKTDLLEKCKSKKACSLIKSTAASHLKYSNDDEVYEMYNLIFDRLNCRLESKKR